MGPPPHLGPGTVPMDESGIFHNGRNFMIHLENSSIEPVSANILESLEKSHRHYIQGGILCQGGSGTPEGVVAM